jgi:putative ubiquitin-RnfH superfamily antitoxin RatB of RatAB toxin-antitoxin module
MGPAEPQIVVEVVYALPHEQVLLTVCLPPGSTILDALACSGIAQRFPGTDLGKCRVGVFGRACPSTTVLADGDRVELYRPLGREPKEARRARSRQRPSRSDDR